MLRTYRATLRGDRLEWGVDSPRPLPAEKPVAVYVTILDEVVVSPADGRQGERMAAILEQLAALPAMPEITDAAAWEREVRRDRELPNRDS